jgi:hypothetical protein
MLTDDEIKKQIKFLREEKVYDDEGKGSWGILEEAADTIERLAAQIKVKDEAAANLAERLLARVRTLEDALRPFAGPSWSVGDGHYVTIDGIGPNEMEQACAALLPAQTA